MGRVMRREGDTGGDYEKDVIISLYLSTASRHVAETRRSKVDLH